MLLIRNSRIGRRKMKNSRRLSLILKLMTMLLINRSKMLKKLSMIATVKSKPRKVPRTKLSRHTMVRRANLKVLLKKEIDLKRPLKERKEKMPGLISMVRSKTKKVKLRDFKINWTSGSD